MPVTTPKPVTINGVTYPSQHAAARALGVTDAAIRKRLKNGVPLSRKFAKYTVPVGTDDGRVFPSVTEAAHALSVSYAYIKRCLKDDRPCRGHRVRRLSEIDIILAEIEQRNRQPYQFARR